MGPFVLDASMTLSWCFASEASERGDAILASLRKSYAVVPSLWPFEVASCLLVAERRNRISADQSVEFIHQLRQLQIHIERRESLWLWQAILPLARQHRLSAYDAAYLDLAKRESLPLATRDAHLHHAALTLHIPVLA